MKEGFVRALQRAHDEGVRDGLAIPIVALAVLWHMVPLYTPPWFGLALVGTDSYRSHDWLEVAKFDHFAREAIRIHHRFPWWNPLVAGGLPQFAHPSDGTMGPLFLPSLLLGETMGMKVTVVIAALLGAIGTFGLARFSLRTSRPAALLAAVAFAWSGWLPSRVAVGFYESCLMTAWPMLLFLWVGVTGVRRRWAHVAAAVLLFALAIQLQLAVPVFVLLMVVLLISSFVQQVLGGPTLPPASARSGLAILAVAALLGGAKFLPMLDLLESSGFREATRYPIHADAWYVSFSQFWYGLFHTVPALPLLDKDGSPRVQEYVPLLPGLGTLVLAGVGAVFGARPGQRAFPWFVVGAVFLWLSFGPHAPFDLFSILHPLPLFRSMRGPLRYFGFPVLLSCCLLSAVGVDGLRSTLALSWPRARVGLGHAWLLALLAILMNLPSAMEGRILYRSAFLFGVPMPQDPVEPRSEGLFGASHGGAQALNLRKYSNLVRGVPTVFQPEDLPIPVAPVPQHWLHSNGQILRDPGYLGEAWPVLADGTAQVDTPDHGLARVIAWLPNEVVIETALVAPGVVAVNQNHRPGWTCGERPVVPIPRDRGVQLGFQAPAGPGVLTRCKYFPPWLVPGLLSSLLGVVGCGLLLRRRPP